MKYGKTERISGIVILLALLAIVVPWLMSDPAPREERPQPTFVIEQPVEAVKRDVPAPEMPATLDTPSPSEPVAPDSVDVGSVDVDPKAPRTESPEADTAEADPAPAPASTPSESASNADPIADLVAANSSSGNGGSGAPATAPQGEWAVQVGSFGEAANAERLSSQLADEGFATFQRERDNDLTTVYVGPYASSEDGESAMSLIKQKANVQGLLVRVRD